MNSTEVQHTYRVEMTARDYRDIRRRFQLPHVSCLHFGLGVIIAVISCTESDFLALNLAYNFIRVL